MTDSRLLEHLTTAWNEAIQVDLEHGVSCLNEQAATEFYQKYPAISAFGQRLHDLYMEQLDD